MHKIWFLMYCSCYFPIQVVTIFAKPFVYTREIEHEEDEEKCLAESGILCSHHEHKTGTVVVLKFQKLFSFWASFKKM